MINYLVFGKFLFAFILCLYCSGSGVACSGTKRGGKPARWVRDLILTLILYICFPINVRLNIPIAFTARLLRVMGLKFSYSRTAKCHNFRNIDTNSDKLFAVIAFESWPRRSTTVKFDRDYDCMHRLNPLCAKHICNTCNSCNKCIQYLQIMQYMQYIIKLCILKRRNILISQRIYLMDNVFHVKKCLFTSRFNLFNKQNYLD